MTLHIEILCLVVQILFVAERDHWVATSYHQDEIRLYDSKISPNLHDSLQEQIALIYKEAANGNTLTVKAIPIPQQTGGEDCGLFFIAYAYHAALGEDLLGITFDQSKMHDHLIACLNQKCLKPFPLQNENLLYPPYLHMQATRIIGLKCYSMQPM